MNHNISLDHDKIKKKNLFKLTWENIGQVLSLRILQYQPLKSPQKVGMVGEEGLQLRALLLPSACYPGYFSFALNSGI